MRVSLSARRGTQSSRGVRVDPLEALNEMDASLAEVRPFVVMRSNFDRLLMVRQE